MLLRAHGCAQLGDGAFYVTSAAYLYQLGFSATGVGLRLSLAWGVGALASPWFGRAADRWSLRSVTPVSTALCCLGLAMLAVGLPLTAPGLVLYCVGQSAWGGLRAALVEELAPSSRRVAERARQQSVGNLAVGLGSVAGGLALATGVDRPLRVVLALDASAYLAVSLLLAHGLPGLRRPTGRSAPGGVSGRQRLATVAAAALYLYLPLLSVALPLLVVTGGAAPRWVVAACFVANTLGVGMLQGAAARWFGDRQPAAAALVGGLLMALSCALFWISLRSGPLALLPVAVALQLAGELAAAAAIWSTGYRLAPPSAQARWQASYGAAAPAARCIGPVVVGVAAAHPTGWVAPASLLLAGSWVLARVAAGPIRPAATDTPDRAGRAGGPLGS